MNKKQLEVVETLAKFPDGLTVNELYCRSNKLTRKTISNALNIFPRWAYIDRWVLIKKKYEAVWCMAIIPDDCPEPWKIHGD
jgi:hypothetical protein